jgi:hypothetical protein
VHRKTAAGPRLRRLEPRGQPDERGLVAEPPGEVHAEDGPFAP